MSANQINTNDTVIHHIGNTLNIDVTGKLTVMDIIDDLSSIQDLAAFRIFVKEKFNYERFRYLTGYQKFLALVNEYKKENIKLDDEQLKKCNSFASKLYWKTISVFDEVNFMIQEGNDIRSKKVSNYIGLAYVKQPKEIEVLDKIGKREELLRLSVCNKPLLEQKIDEAVKELTLIKHYPQLAPKKDEIAINLIQNLANRTRITQ